MHFLLLYISRQKQKSFTLIEILAAIAIIGALLAIITPMVGNYITAAKQQADEQSLLVLNDALTRYKTQGGSLSAPNCCG